MPKPVLPDLTALASGITLPEPSERTRLRIDHGATQEEVARALGVTRKTVSSWEQGAAEPTGDRLARYAHLLRLWQESERK